MSAAPTVAEPPLQRLRCPHGELAWREAGQGEPLVLLHGIGSGSGSWAGQFAGLAGHWRVLAWDAPGYGGSAPLPDERPRAEAYAQALADWLAALGVTRPVLLGHSLGAIVAAAWAARADASPRAWLMASPARGYGRAAPAEREAKYRERLALVDELGIAGLAAARSAGLCAPDAAAETIERVRAQMARATPQGYRQAAHLLAFDDLATHLARAPRPAAVLCGALDRVTPPAACAEVAAACGATFVSLARVGHACYVEDADSFNRAVCEALAPAAPGVLHV